MTEQSNTMTEHRSPGPIRLLVIALVVVVITAAFGVTDASAHHRTDHETAPRSTTTTTTTTSTVTVTLHIHDQEEAEVEVWLFGWWDEPTEEVVVPVAEKGGHRRCTVEVADGARGDVVLEAAKSTGCIDSYDLGTGGGDKYVRCVDGRCNHEVRDDSGYWTDAGLMWAQFSDDRWIRYLHWFQAAEGRTLRLSYAAEVSACPSDPFGCVPVGRVTAPTP